MPLVKNSEIEKEKSEYIAGKDVSVTLCSPNCLLACLNEKARVVRTGQTSATELTVILDSDHLLVPLFGSARSRLHVLGEQQGTAASKNNWEKLLGLNHPSLMKVFCICDCMAEVEICRGEEFEDVGTTPKWKKLRDLTDKANPRISRPYPFTKWKGWMSDLAKGLAELERLGLAHGDPYPFNAISDVMGAKWIDFSHLSNDPLQINKDAWAFILFTVIHTHRDTDFFSKSMMQQLALCLHTKDKTSIFDSIIEVLAKDYLDLEALTDVRQPLHYFGEFLGKTSLSEADQFVSTSFQELLVKAASQYFSDFLHNIKKSLDHVTAYQIEKQRNRLMEREMIRLAIPRAEYERVIVERDDQIINLRQALTEKDNQITNLNQVVAERDSQIANLHQSAQQSKTERDSLFKQLDQVLKSHSWKITRPARAALRFIRHGYLDGAGEKGIFQVARFIGRVLPFPLWMKARVRSALLKWQYPAEMSLSPELQQSKHFASKNLFLPSASSKMNGMRAECCGLKPGLVSVVLPVYNQAYLLDESIQSVLAQTYQNFELIIVNDGSTDDVQAVLDCYLNHPRVRCFNQNNQKLPKALTNGFTFATGEFWTWTSADNLMDCRMLELMVKKMQSEPDVAMVYADYYAIDDRGVLLQDTTWRAHNRPDPKSGAIRLPRTTENLNEVQDNFIGPCFIYRGWIGRCLRDYDPQLGIEDYDYWMRINAFFKIQHLGTDDLLYRYRVHDNTLSARAQEHRIFEKAQLLMKYEQERTNFYRRSPLLFADSYGLSWLTLRGVTIESIRSLPIESDFQVNEELIKADLLILTSETAMLYLGTLIMLPTPVAIIFDLNDLQYQQLQCLLNKPNFLALVPDQLVADRVRLVSSCPVLDLESSQSFPGALAFAKNYLFFKATRSPEEQKRELPQRLIKSIGRRILLQVDNFTQGGMENVVIDLGLSLRTAGFEVIIGILGTPGDAAEKAREHKLKVEILPSPLTQPDYVSWLKNNNVSLVNAHYSIFGAAGCRKEGIPFIETIHNSYVWFDAEITRRYRQADQHITMYICVSKTAAQYADVVLGLDVSKMLVVPNGIDINNINATRFEINRDSLRKKWQVSSQTPVFLNVASVMATKAQLPLVRAFAQVVEQIPDARLIFLGGVLEKPYQRAIEQAAKDLKLQNHVIFAGYHRDVTSYYHAADVFVLPSYWEGWSLSLAEAMANGLSCVITDVGSAYEFDGFVNVEIIKPPFNNITDLNYQNLGNFVYGVNSAFEQRLAKGMIKMASRKRGSVDIALAKRLDRAIAYQKYAEIFIDHVS